MTLYERMVSKQEFSIGAEVYRFDVNGVLFQLNPNPVTYDDRYVEARYNSYGELGPRMAHLRLGYLLGVLGRVPSSLLDVGYGNGDFLRAANSIISDVVGNDAEPMYPITPIKTTDNIYEHYHEVVSFFDVLEHFTDPYDIKNLKCRYIIISVPNLSLEFSESEFANWKHRRPNEHIVHFSIVSLQKFFLDIGFTCISSSNIEDSIRKNTALEIPNITTCVFKRF